MHKIHITPCQYAAIPLLGQLLPASKVKPKRHLGICRSCVELRELRTLYIVPSYSTHDTIPLGMPIFNKMMQNIMEIQAVAKFNLKVRQYYWMCQSHNGTALICRPKSRFKFRQRWADLFYMVCPANEFWGPPIEAIKVPFRSKIILSQGGYLRELTPCLCSNQRHLQ